MANDKTNSFTLADFFVSTKSFTQFAQVGAIFGQLSLKNIQNEVERDVALSNSRIAEMQAQFELQKGKEQASKVLAQGEELIQGQIASYGASGAELGYGSTKDVSWRTRMQVQRDADIVRFNSTMSALGFTTKSNELKASAKISETQKKNSTAWMPVLGAAVEATANTYGTYLKAKKAGLDQGNALETPIF